MNSQSKNQYLDILQVFRGIAALMVVLHHSVASLRYYHKIDYPLLNYMASIGKFGVDFFFVLSGFIITYSAFSNTKNLNPLTIISKIDLFEFMFPIFPSAFLCWLFTPFCPDFQMAIETLVYSLH